MRAIRCFCFCLLLLPSTLLAEEHPLLSAYEGSSLRNSQVEAYTEYARIIGFADRVVQTELLQGRLHRLIYQNPKQRSTLEILTNYQQALEEQGLQVDYSCVGRNDCGTIANPSWNAINRINVGAASDVRYFTGHLLYQQSITYVAVAVNPAVTVIHILESSDMERGLVVADAAALAAGLQAHGRIRVDGIYFDTGKAELKAESGAAISQIAMLLQQEPDLKLYVVGHTDSTGDFAANMRLSASRAESVRHALLSQHGIAAGRIQAHGVSSLAPAGSNRTEQGRAYNRRVEIVAQ